MQEARPAYSSTFSRKDFTQHQLFALLTLKTFFKTDHRGTVQRVEDFAELRDDLGLTDVPHYSALCYAAQQLLKRGVVLLLGQATLHAQDSSLIGAKPEASLDATGLESRLTSRYFFNQEELQAFAAADGAPAPQA